MSADDGIQKSIENVCQIIRSVKCTSDDKVDAYFTLFRYFQSNKEECVTCIVKSINSLFTVVQKHLHSEEKSLIEATLAFLGHALSVEEIIQECQENTLNSLCRVLCTLLEESTEKSAVIRTLWCFSHQVLPESLIKEHVKTLVNAFIKVHTDGNMKSETVNNEALRMMKRLCEQCPDELKVYICEWIPHVFNLMVTDSVKNREAALNVIETGMVMLLEKQNYMCTFLLDEMNNKDFCTKLNTLFHNDTSPVHVLNTWSCILRLLKESFFELNRVKVTNPLLKIAEKSFGSKTAEVTLALNNLWRALIDAVFTRPGEFGKRMEKIFLLPIRIRYKNEVIAQENLKTQWHLMCKIGPKINDYVEKALNPLLDVYLKTSSSVNGTSTPDVNNKSVSTPVRSDQQHKNDLTTITPKSPYNVSSKTKLLAAEMLLQLLTEKKERQLSRSLKLELFTAPCISNENVIKNCRRYTSYLLNITETCGTKHEGIVTNVWVAFLLRLRHIAETEGNTAAKEVWTPVLMALQEMVDRWLSNCMLPLKILLLIPENVLKMSIPELGTIANDSRKNNPDGLVSLFTVQLLLHKKSLDNEAFDQERYFILYERVIGTIFSSVTNQLHIAETVFEYLKEANSDITIQNVRWRLWSTLASLLASYITRTNDVNQAGIVLDYNFQAVLKSLTHPLKFIDLSKLTEGTTNEMLKVWQEIFEIFTRSVALLSGVEINLALEKVFQNINEILGTSLTDSKLLQTVIQIIAMTSKYIDHSNINKIFSTRLTPTKVTKKLNNPLGNLTSYVGAIRLSLNKCFELNPKEGKVMDSAIIQLLDIVEIFYENVESGNVLTHSLYQLIPPLSKLLGGSSSKNKFSSKVTVKMEKVVFQIFTSIENNNSLLFHSELLQKLEPILVKTLSSARKPLRTRTGQFWNRTFGKTKELVYSMELKSVLTKYQSKLNLVLSGAENSNNRKTINFSESFIDDTAQFPDSSMNQVMASPNLKTKSATLASPIKIHGSFMPSGKKSPKHSSSGKPSSPSQILGNFLASGSRNNSPMSPFKGNSKTVRRKLPVGLNTEDSCDYVEIKDSPATKKKRILTEHQKDRIRERKEIPVMYNDLDQSQDTVMRSLSQDLTQDSSQFRLPEQPIENKNSDVAKLVENNPKDESIQLSSIGETSRMKLDSVEERPKDVLYAAKVKPVDCSAPVKNTTSDDPIESGKDTEKEDDRSFEMIPSSQTQDNNNTQPKKRESLLASQMLKLTPKQTKCSISNHPITIHSSNSSSVDNSTANSCTETCTDAPNVTPNNTDGVNSNSQKVIGDVCETEEIQLFEESPKLLLKTANQSENAGTVLQNNSNMEQSCIQNDFISIPKDQNRKSQENNSKGPAAEMPTVSHVDDKEKNNASTLNMEAKIVVDKLPSTRRKRKRSVVTAATPTFGQQQKKRRAEAKENKPVEDKKIKKTSTKPMDRRRKSVGRKAVTTAIMDMPKNTPDEAVDIFEFAEEQKNEATETTTPNKRKRGRRKKLEQNSLPDINKGISDSNVTTNQQLESKVIKESPVPLVNLTEEAPTANHGKDGHAVTLDVHSNDDEERGEVLPESQEAAIAQPIELPSKKQADLKSTKIADEVEECDTSFKEKSKLENNRRMSLPANLQLQSATKGTFLNSPSVSSPINKTLVKNPFLNHSVSSPSRVNCVPSPISSPATGILKKRLTAYVDSPSPPNKRRVSFQLPSGAIILPDDDLACPIPDGDAHVISKHIGKPFTMVRKKSKEKKKFAVKAAVKSAVFPDLISCKVPIEKILPSLTFSRGVGHLVRAQNILTVGDLSALSENQIEALPIRSPKVSTVRNALKSFSTQISRDKPIPKSPLVIGQPHDDSFMDSETPTKDETSLVDEAALLLTPSRRHDDVKPTSLFLSSMESFSTSVTTTTTTTTTSATSETPYATSTIEEEGNKTPESCKTKTTVASTTPEICLTTSQGVDEKVPQTSETIECKDLTREAATNKPVKVELEQPESPVNITIPENSPGSSGETSTTDIPEKPVACVDKQTGTSQNQTAGQLSEHDIKTLLEQLSGTFDQCNNLSNSELFNVISQLDQLSKTAMSILRTRMSENH